LVSLRFDLIKALFFKIYCPFTLAREIIPLDCDLLSLQHPSIFEQVFVEEDLSLLSSIPRSLLGIQALFGNIGNRYGIGKNAITALDQVCCDFNLIEEDYLMVETIFQLEIFESVNPNARPIKGEISSLLIVDRNVDYATCLLSPVTYESLLDEVERYKTFFFQAIHSLFPNIRILQVFNIVCGTVELDPNRVPLDMPNNQVDNRHKIHKV